MLRFIVLILTMMSAYIYANDKQSRLNATITQNNDQSIETFKNLSTSSVWENGSEFPFLNPLDTNWWKENSATLDTVWFKLEGDSIVAKWKISQAIAIKTPQIVDLYSVQKMIEEACLLHGYPFGILYFRFDSLTASSAYIGVRVEHGPAYLLGDPIFSGSSTKNKVLLRLYRTDLSEYFHPTKIEDGVTRLKATEYFESVDLLGYYRPPHQRLIIPRIAIEDRKQSSLSGAAGYNGDAGGTQNPWQGMFAADVYNLLGTGRDLHLYWKGDTKTTKLRAAYREPWLGPLPWSLNISGNLYWQDTSYRESKADFEMINESSSTQKWGLVGGVESTFERVTEADTNVSSSAYYSGLVYRYKKTDRIDLPRYGFVWEAIGKMSNRANGASKELTYKNEIDASLFYTWKQMGIHPRILSKSTWPANRAKMVAGDMWRLGGSQNLRGQAEDIFLVPAYYLGQVELFYDLGHTTRVYGFSDLAWLDDSPTINHRWEGGYGAGLCVGQSNWWLNLFLAGNSDRSFEEYLLFVQVENRF